MHPERFVSAAGVPCAHCGATITDGVWAHQEHWCAGCYQTAAPVCAGGNRLLPTGQLVTSLATYDGRTWHGWLSGALYVSGDGGRTWAPSGVRFSMA